jgi:hypothetical protein
MKNLTSFPDCLRFYLCSGRSRGAGYTRPMNIGAETTRLMGIRTVFRPMTAKDTK